LSSWSARKGKEKKRERKKKERGMGGKKEKKERGKREKSVSFWFYPSLCKKKNTDFIFKK
jgi:hypothetical protein